MTYTWQRRNGHRFGFVRFKGDINKYSMEQNLNNIWIGTFRPNKKNQPYGRSGPQQWPVGQNLRDMRSYKEVVNSNIKSDEMLNKPDGTKNAGTKNDKKEMDKVTDNTEIDDDDVMIIQVDNKGEEFLLQCIVATATDVEVLESIDNIMYRMCGSKAYRWFRCNF